VTIQAPQLDINTVAAGGGSRLFFRDGTFVVGPESAGGALGWVCWAGAGGAGGWAGGTAPCDQRVQRQLMAPELKRLGAAHHPSTAAPSTPDLDS
jgi:N-methylhydantoinase A/oxoprolinase/acetone carboxylase beta subunit